MDGFVFIQNLDEIFQINEQTKNKNKNAGRFGLVPNMCPRFRISKKMKNKKGGPDWTPL
jgi:hypothetical protein